MVDGDAVGRARGTGGTVAAVVEEPVPVEDLDNNTLVVRLHFTVNHLSRWLSPVHNQRRLQRSSFRGSPPIAALVARLREEEESVYPWMHAIAHRATPDLDLLPEPQGRVVATDGRQPSAMAAVAEFRRVRQSTCSLLRSLPDTAWSRRGVSRRGRNWTLRELAERLATHDRRVLAEMDGALAEIGVREGIATVSGAGVDELLRLAPVRTR